MRRWQFTVLVAMILIVIALEVIAIAANLVWAASLYTAILDKGV